MLNVKSCTCASAFPLPAGSSEEADWSHPSSSLKILSIRRESRGSNNKRVRRIYSSIAIPNKKGSRHCRTNVGKLHSTTNIIGGGIPGCLLLNIYGLRLSIIAFYTLLASVNKCSARPELNGGLGKAGQPRGSGIRWG